MIEDEQTTAAVHHAAISDEQTTIPDDHLANGDDQLIIVLEQTPSARC